MFSRRSAGLGHQAAKIALVINRHNYSYHI
jgi:hypothetical protein